MKVVFDTSVVVSAVLKDRVPEEVILFVLGNPDFTWTASSEIVSEYLTVIKRGSSISPKRSFKNGKVFSSGASRLRK